MSGHRARGKARSGTATLTPFLALIGVLLALLAVPAAASAAGTLDQSQEATDGTGFIVGKAGASSFARAQTFTAGRTGDLDHVDLRLGRDATCDLGDLTVQLRTTSGGIPTSTVLATATVPSSTVPASPDWVSVPFPTPPPSVSGTQYAIVLSAPGGDDLCFYNWTSKAGDPYSGGTAGPVSFDGGSTWTDQGSSFDATFRTFVVEPTAAKQCADGTDNDSDNKVDYPDDQGCSSADDDSESPDASQCSDRLDNDGDGKKNYPDDPGCSSPGDDDESNVSRPPPPPPDNCTRRGTAGNDVIYGTPGNDVICAGGGNDIVYGRGGNDTIYGGSGNDVLRGGPGEDRLLGGEGDDELIGGDGADRLFGGLGRDVLSGQDERDFLNTRDNRGGNDVANGGAGADSCDTDGGDARTSC